jgi:ParB family transcriptional regulator, chromosome partitioning protein
MATQLAVAGEILHIPVNDIFPSKNNPRGRPSPEGIEDLAADITRRGVQQPIVVRPAKSKEGKYEIIFGERRWTASKKADKETVPSVIRDLSDEEAYEAQVIENLQREDLHPLAESAAFKRLYQDAYKKTNNHDKAIELAAEKLGKKRTPEFIARRLKLNDLVEEAKTAFQEGTLLLGHADELARLRPEEQKAALQWLLREGREVQTSCGWKKANIVPGVPELRFWIQQNLFLDLTKAPFDTNDPKLNPEMGACTGCRYRTGNQPALFGDVQKDETCTVPICWATKRNNALIQIANTRAKELGVKKVLKVGLGYASWNNAKLPVDVYIEYNSPARLVKKGEECKQTQPGVITWIGHASDSAGRKPGDAVLVCPKASECPKHKNADSRAVRQPKTFEQMADTRISNLRQDTRQRVRSALIAAVVRHAMKAEASLSKKYRAKFEPMANQMHSDLFFDRHRDLCKLLGVEPKLDRYKSKHWRGTTRDIFEGNPLALMVAMTVMHAYHSGSYGPHGDPLPTFLRLYKINPAVIEKKVKAEIGQKIAGIQESLRKRKAKQQKAKQKKSASAKEKK